MQDARSLLDHFWVILLDISIVSQKFGLFLSYIYMSKVVTSSCFFRILSATTFDILIRSIYSIYLLVGFSGTFLELASSDACSSHQQGRMVIDWELGVENWKLKMMVVDEVVRII